MSRMPDVTHEHFVTMLGNCWDQARLAALPVQLTLRDGSVVLGLPDMPAHPYAGRRVDATGVAVELRLGGTAVKTVDVTGYGVRFAPVSEHAA